MATKLYNKKTDEVVFVDASQVAGKLASGFDVMNKADRKAADKEEAAKEAAKK